MSELIDRQAAIEELKSYIIDPKKAISENPYDVFQYNAGIRTAVGVIMELPAASPWHRVEDELPKIGKIVLVYDDLDRLSICQLDNRYRWFRQGGGWIDVPYARYWMPIPEPPKEDA